MVSDKAKRLINTLVLSAFLILVMISAPQTVGLAAKGFDTTETLQQFFFYSASGIAFLIGILILFTIEFIIVKDDSTYGNSLAFNSPTESLALIKTKKFLTLFLGSIVVFGLLGLFAVFTRQNTFTGIGVLEQQFTPVSSLIFTSLLIPASENLGAAFIIAFAFFGLRWIARKRNLSRGNFVGFVYLIPLLVGFYGVANHLLRYGASEISLLGVFMFWTIGGVITIMTYSFIPFWVMHISNNLFFDLQRFYANEAILIWTGAAIVIVSILFILTLRKGKKEAIISN